MNWACVRLLLCEFFVSMYSLVMPPAQMDRCERGDVEPFCCENSGRDLGREGVGGGRECRAGTERALYVNVPSGHSRLGVGGAERALRSAERAQCRAGT